MLAAVGRYYIVLIDKRGHTNARTTLAKAAVYTGSNSATSIVRSVI